MTNLNRSSPNLRLVPPRSLNDFRDLGIRHWRHPWDQVQACLGPFIQTAGSALFVMVRSASRLRLLGSNPLAYIPHNPVKYIYRYMSIQILSFLYFYG
ncbi:hypothetical protein HanRHA438_Chr15g0699411 [Helianthus annuus]|nr:hypothetical protein HanIR_Chr15g0746721 [Helianthus annuus]KAJ0844167.1 hypothetical protein HanRHA438_Chr15g0699411 [Helianthus annuus]